MNWIFNHRDWGIRTPDHLTKSEVRPVMFIAHGRVPSRWGWHLTSLTIYVRDYDHAQEARHQIPHMRVDRIVRVPKP